MQQKNQHALPLKLFRYSLWACAAAYLVVYLIVVIKRSRYPYELEWMEGGVVDHVRRILAGDQIYVEPSIDFVPYSYAPLFFYLGAVFSKVFGTGFFSLRLLSIIASLGCLAVIFEFVRRETASVFLGVISAGFFAATYKISGDWLDIARADSLYLLLLLGSVFLLRFRDDSRFFLFLAGLLTALSFLTKQTAIFIAVAMSIYCLIWLPGWKKIVYPATFGIVAGAATLVMNLLSAGWFYYYVYELPRHKTVLRSQLDDFWLHGMVVVSVALALSLIFLIFVYFKARRKDFGFYLLFFASMLASSWYVSIFYGSYLNFLIPAVAAISILMGLGTGILTSGVRIKPGNGSRDKLLDTGGLAKIAVLLAVLIQLVSLVYNPRELLPSADDERAGDAFVERMRGIEGEIFLPNHGYLTALAGKKTYAHQVAIVDVMLAEGEEGTQLQQQLAAAVEGRIFGAIILDGKYDAGWWPWAGLADATREGYIYQGVIFEDGAVFRPVTGNDTRPDALHVRRP